MGRKDEITEKSSFGSGGPGNTASDEFELEFEFEQSCLGQTERVELLDLVRFRCMVWVGARGKDRWLTLSQLSNVDCWNFMGKLSVSS